MAIYYSTGEEAKPGDRVEFNRELSTVEDVIHDDAALQRWGLDEPGLMLTNTTFGRVFEPLEGAVLGESVVFLGRKP